MPPKRSAKKSAKKSARQIARKSPKKSAKRAKSPARIKKPAAPEPVPCRAEKVLVRRLEGNWEEWAAWHTGGVATTAPDTHVGWHITAEHPVTAEHWAERYDRWVKMEWRGEGTPFDLH
jgi:hypothetical protein